MYILCIYVYSCIYQIEPILNDDSKNNLKNALEKNILNESRMVSRGVYFDYVGFFSRSRCQKDIKILYFLKWNYMIF